ncbi:MAG: type II and III secretion system protein family protein [Phycisphaerae bacterium]
MKPEVKNTPQVICGALRRALRLTACAVLFAAPAAGQSADGGDAHEVKITVSDVSRSDQLIRVPAGKSVVIEFSQPVREARVPKPDVAEVAAVAPNKLLVTGKAFGATQLVVFLNEKTQKVFDIAVEIELDRLTASIRAVAPRSNVKAYAVLNSVVLTGTVPDAETAQRVMDITTLYSKDVMNHMKVAGVQQVLLRCTVAEVNRRAVNQLGFNGWIAGDNVRDMFALSNLNGINPSNIGAAAGANVTSRIPILTGEDGIPVTGNTTLSFGFPRVPMQIFIQALRENGLLRVLAEPNLVTVNGQQANFLAGGEFPIPVPQGGANNAVTIEYREFGVRLQFTPTVLNENVIRMRVTPEVSEPDFSSAVTIGGFVVPGLVQRRVDTVVELGSGQTFAIGGLLSERVRGTARKVPALGDVPVLGALFTSTEYRSEQTELVVLVTPELVEPVSPNQVTKVPGGNMVRPNDWEVYVMGELEGKPASPPPPLHREGSVWPVRPGDVKGQAPPTGSPAQPKNGSDARMRGPVGLASADDD